VKSLRKIMTSAVFCAMVPAVAQAELLKYSNVVQDTQTGLVWLQLSETRGLSINQVLSGVGYWTRHQPLIADSTLYRYATNSEIATLIEHYGMYASDYTTGNFGAGRFIFGIGGTTGSAAGTYFNDGNQGAIGMSPSAFVNALLTNGDNGNAFSPTCAAYTGCERVTIDYSSRLDQLNFSSPSVGSFLVAIPEPETLALLGAGLLAFAASRRKAT
jgi:hypothetical protein